MTPHFSDQSCLMIGDGTDPNTRTKGGGGEKALRCGLLPENVTWGIALMFPGLNGQLYEASHLKRVFSSVVFSLLGGGAVRTSIRLGTSRLNGTS